MMTPWLWTFLVSSGHFMVDFYGNFLTPLLPFLGKEWALTNSQLAMIVSIHSLTANFSQPVFGYWMDRDLCGWSFVWPILIMGFPMCFLYLADSYWLLIVFAALAGLGSAIYHPLGAKRVNEGADGQKALNMSFYSSLGNLGYAVSPAIVAYMAAAKGMTSLAYLMVPGLLWIMIMRGYQKRKPYETTDQEKQVMKKIPWSSYRPLLKISAIVSLRSWVTMGTTVFIPLWMVTQGYSEAVVGVLLTCFLIAGSAGSFFSGFLCPRLGEKQTIVLSFVLTMVLLPLFLLNTGWLQIVFLLLLGFIAHVTNPITIVMGQSLLPGQAGLASGMTMGFAFGLGGLGITITGVWADLWGMVAALLITSLALIPAIFLVFTVPKSDKKEIGKDIAENL